MFISEDGTVTGSVDVNKLDQIKPSTEEAKAQHAALKADVEAGQEQAAADAERLAEAHRRQHAYLYDDDEGRQARSESEKAAAEDSAQQQQVHDERRRADEDRARQERIRSGRATDADRAVEAQRSQGSQSDDPEVERLRTQAEKAGVTVDKRWGADRLRQEIDAAKTRKG